MGGGGVTGELADNGGFEEAGTLEETGWTVFPNGGSISVEYGPGTATVVFDSIPEFLWGGSNSFAVVLRDDGSFTIEYGWMDGPEGLAGATEGGGAADPGETDLSASGPFPASGTTYENFDGFDNDLSGATLEFMP